MGVTIQDTDAGPRVVEAFADGGAAKAGIQKDDLITHILHQQVRDLNELQRAVREQRVGDTIQVTVRRADQEIRFNVVLSMPQDVFTGMGRVDRVNGAVSSRRDDFPIAIQHDTVLDPTQCGGPLVDLRGRVVGINVARADRIACYAVPLDTVVALFDELKTDQSATD
jgi:serine protease Do